MERWVNTHTHTHTHAHKYIHIYSAFREDSDPFTFFTFCYCAALCYNHLILEMFANVLKRKKLKRHIDISIQTLYSVLSWCTFGSDNSLESSWGITQQALPTWWFLELLWSSVRLDGDCRWSAMLADEIVVIRGGVGGGQFRGCGAQWRACLCGCFQVVP